MPHRLKTPSSESARAISRELVALTKEYSGRGPTGAKTYLHDDLVVCVLHDTLTQAELSLAAEARTELVGEIRRSFQGALRDQAIAAVERITGRRVISFLGDHDVATDHGVIVFLLAELSEKTPEFEAPPSG